MKSADDVLADLESVGAVGGPAKAPAAPSVEVREVTIERGEPSASLKDLRGEEAVTALDAAVRHLDAAIGELTAMRESLVRLREVWEPVDSTSEPPDVALETPDTVSTAPNKPEAPSTPSPTTRSPEPVEEPSGSDYERARAAALRKIRGEDIPESALDDEDDVPFVGQVRASMPGMEPEEITIGTIDTIKPSFPVEENDGT